MRIISPFKDAYDSILWNMEVEPGVFWNRTPWIADGWMTKYSVQNNGFNAAAMKNIYQKYGRTFFGLDGEIVFVFLCGRIFTGIFLSGYGYIYDPDVFLEKVKERTKKEEDRFERNVDFAKSASFLMKKNERSKDFAESMKNHAVQEDLLEEMINLQTPVIVVASKLMGYCGGMDAYSFYRGSLDDKFDAGVDSGSNEDVFGRQRFKNLDQHPVLMVGNPPELVKTLNLARAISLEEIAQEIRVFFSGIASQAENVKQIVDDKVLLAAKGFVDCSFKSCHPGRQAK